MGPMGTFLLQITTAVTCRVVAWRIFNLCCYLKESRCLFSLNDSYCTFPTFPVGQEVASLLIVQYSDFFCFRQSPTLPKAGLQMTILIIGKCKSKSQEGLTLLQLECVVSEKQEIKYWWRCGEQGIMYSTAGKLFSRKQYRSASKAKILGDRAIPLWVRN